MRRKNRIKLFFGIWIGLAALVSALHLANIKWTDASVPHALLLWLLLSFLHGSVMEAVVITVTAMITRHLVNGRLKDKAPVYDNKLSVIINYNLLAYTEIEIDEAFENMYQAFMGNLGHKISAVLVSATNSEGLIEYEGRTRDSYRQKIRAVLIVEGRAYAMCQYTHIHPHRLEHFWKRYEVQDFFYFYFKKIYDIAEGVAEEFMCIHRVSRILKKCGQYQDLITLSEGHMLAYTYTYRELYGSAARNMHEPLFVYSSDVQNIYRRCFDCTLVLDSDTSVIPGSIRELLAIAAAHPRRGIIQPVIKMVVSKHDTLFMHLENWRQSLNEPIYRYICRCLGQSSFFGKGLIRNRPYFENIIGTPKSPIERVPMDVLSHDTYEAAILRPLYAHTVHLLEVPSTNYVTWHLRERRWNQGEFILGTYFWPRLFGAPVHFIRHLLQRHSYSRVKLRTHTKLDLLTSYIAHRAFRVMVMKPLLLLYIIIHLQLQLHVTIEPLVFTLFLVIIFPKLAVMTRLNVRLVLIETFMSVLQFTPESVVGAARTMRALLAIIFRCLSNGWIPQRAVEERFRGSNGLVVSVRFLWPFSLAAVAVTAVIPWIDPNCRLLYFVLVCTFLLPLYAAITNLPFSSFRCPTCSRGFCRTLASCVHALCRCRPKLRPRAPCSNHV